MKEDKITLSYGSGGLNTQRFIKEYVLKYFNNDILAQLTDSAILELPKDKNVAFTIDGYTVNPIFFPAGDIGKLSICGTINDLSAVAAEPKYISSAVIIEEGLEFEIIEKIFSSMKEIAEQENVSLVTGDTKVVEKGSCDKIFIITSGIGFVDKTVKLGYERISPKDKIIVSNNLAEHGFAILLSRGSFGFKYDIKSDCAPLWSLVKQILLPEFIPKLKFFRDITRGGLASVLNEIVIKNPLIGIKIEESLLPISDTVKTVSDILGIDYLYVASEGCMLVIVDESIAEKVVEIFHNHPLGKNACIIGEITEDFKGKVVLKTLYRALRVIDMPVAEQLPRIC